MTPKKGHTMRIVRTALFAAALTSMSSVAYAQGKPAPKDVKLYFISPRDGQQIKGGFWARFGLRNMGVTHAGDEYQNSGHHHLLIDVTDALDPKEPIAQDKAHMHFGAGQTETFLELAPGRHSLQLVLGDARHFPFDPPVVSEKISIQVVDPLEPEKAKRGHRRRGS
jgi:hypothetical protein